MSEPTVDVTAIRGAINARVSPRDRLDSAYEALCQLTDQYQAMVANVNRFGHRIEEAQAELNEAFTAWRASK